MAQSGSQKHFLVKYRSEDLRHLIKTLEEQFISEALLALQT